MGTVFVGGDTHRATEREEMARTKLYDYNRQLRGALLDLLALVRASDDRWGASTGMPESEPESLRRRAAKIEHQDAIIHRAREIIDGTKDAKRFIGKLPSEADAENEDKQ